jgi:hypothetical protein
VNLRRGILRLATGVVVLWLVFWTCAYVIRSRSSENGPPPAPPFSLTTDLALIAVAIIGVPWVVSGFRSN